MTRNERIWQEALVAADENPNDFVKGADWYRNNVWHKATDKPKKGCWILVKKCGEGYIAGEFEASLTNEENGLTAFTVIVKRDGTKKDARIFNAIEWASIEDLIADH